LDIARRVLIPIKDKPAIRTGMGAHTQRLWDARSTAATVLAGKGRGHGYNPTPGACCLGFEDATKRRPTSITDALGKVMVSYHVGDLQVFEVNGVVGSEQMQRGLMMEVGALALHRLMRPLKQSDRLAPTVAALLATAHDALRLGDLLLTTPM
jgi:hypothetical protein